MDTYTIMIVALGAGIVYMGLMLFKRVRAFRSMPDEDTTSQRSDVQRLLQKHLEEQQKKSEEQDSQKTSDKA
ncbi:MAG: hypothetical protein L0Y80_03770 [Ignavibacteriae bacterium]|nr:hypothetical protein [Ignavibacteriota bacterium]